MISLGSVSFNAEGMLIGSFKRNFKELPGSRQHPDTMKFWEKNSFAWKKATEDQVSPLEGLKEYVEHLERLKET